MHECSVVENLIRVTRAHLKDSKVAKVKSINLVVGELTGYVDDSLRFYFRVLSKDTELEGAEINVTYVKPKLRCEKCGKIFERARFSFDCPDCGVPGEMTKEGTEFYIDTIEVEE
ncbi:MAG TPA: hydrogenase maturation nickel metallochaperone HypA [Spirochaetota bacterium]